LQPDASPAQTSVDATLPIVTVPLAVGMVGCLTFAVGTFLSGRMGASLQTGWAS
jgi:hypothetical protein